LEPVEGKTVSENDLFGSKGTVVTRQRFEIPISEGFHVDDGGENDSVLALQFLVIT
jgi:hypothetical protein